MPTIKDVAEMAGVSVATVSRVINRSPLVLENTRVAVDNAVRTLGYHPNMLGRNLRRSETRLVLVLLPNIANPFYPTVVKGIEDEARENGYSIMLCNTDSDPKREALYLGFPEKKLADGVIFMASALSAEALEKASAGFPAVQCCEYVEGASLPHISIDNFRAAYDAVSYLVSTGHKRISYIGADPKYISSRQREAGYLKALADHGIVFEQRYLRHGDYSYSSGRREAVSLLALHKKPDAIFAASDIMAAGAISGIFDSGLSVPDDVSVMGFDGISYGSMFRPQLSTVSQPKYELGRKAMETLIVKLSGDTDPMECVTLGHEILIRESTKKRKAGD